MIREKYQETIDYLYRQLPMYQRIGAAAYKKDLRNIVALTGHLGNPHLRYPVVHIAGTNGKGSTAHMIAAILQAHGLKTGLYVSPHYRDFRERIKLDGQYVPKSFIIRFVERHNHFFEVLKPSFFEITLAVAFDYFATSKADVAVIETGLGGRLDSTNIVRPVLSVITNISFDHMEMLGDTLPLIAGEKAGIIKPGVPVVIGETQEETRPVFDRVSEEGNSPIIYADQHFQAVIRTESLTHTTFDLYQDGILRYPGLEANLHGEYQARNLQTVLQSAECLKDRFALTESSIREGLYRLQQLTRFMGRWQTIHQHPTILCDSAHNEGGLRLAMEQLQRLSCQQLHMVIGMVKDKDIDNMLALLPVDARYYFAKADIPRGMEAEKLREKAAAFGLKGKAYTSVANALRAARRQAKPDDLIYVGGSTYVVAEVI